MPRPSTSAASARPVASQTDDASSQITLGTTRKNAGSAEAFERIDRGYPVTLAKTARTEGSAQKLVYLSVRAQAQRLSLRLTGSAGHWRVRIVTIFVPQEQGLDGARARVARLRWSGLLCLSLCCLELISVQRRSSSGLVCSRAPSVESRG